MNDDDIQDLFARQARQRHAQALAAISPRTRAQLHNRLQAALASARHAPAHGWRWAAASALALGLALLLPQGGNAPPAAMPAAQVAATATPVTTLEQDPEFYVWLASADALALASE
jgi:hypothetical protein